MEDRKTQKRQESVKVGGVTIPVTKEEREALEARFQAYVNRYGGPHGFFSRILRDV